MSEFGFKDLNFKVSTSDGRNVTLLEDADYVSVDGTIYRLPSGSSSDGASTPRELWAFGLAPFGTYWKAAFGHDCAYRNTLLKYDGKSFVLANLTKESCDGLIKEMMQSLSVDHAIIEKIYWGVVLGGWKSFSDDRKATK